MNSEYHKHYSRCLQQDMELKVYGEAGKPVLVFPAQGGRFYEYEDFGMIAACEPFITGGLIQLFTVDSIDNQSWANWNAHPADRACRHEAYDRYIVEELTPFIRARVPEGSGFLATGVSMGGYHAGNFFFRHPDVFDSVIALSGIFRLNMFLGDYMDEIVYLNSPLAYLPNMEDTWFLDRYRRSQIVVVTGQGAWEDPMLQDARDLRRILETKGVPAWIDEWGYDVNHDWPWWRKMMPYYLGKLFEKKI